ncbi:hypothetical protein D557_1531 [Bordetella holmesii 70147]|nr:hypothetical protein D557_1531 [Bordetella holmesii 70147]
MDIEDGLAGVFAIGHGQGAAATRARSSFEMLQLVLFAIPVIGIGQRLLARLILANSPANSALRAMNFI